jgi:hypothetical protein
MPQAFAMSQALRNISDSTGGRSVTLDNVPQRFVPAMFSENSLHYTLAYEAPGVLADGRYRRIEVRVGRPGVVVEPGGSRMFAVPRPAAVTGAATTHALSGVVPLSDESLRLAVAAFANPAADGRDAAEARVTLSLGVDVPADAGMGEVLDLELRVFDGEGRKEILARQDAVRVPRTSRYEPRAFDLLQTVALRPGRYNVRMSLVSAMRDRRGSVYTDITIPDYARVALSLSGVAVQATPSRTPLPPHGVLDVLPVTPTTSRTFATSDRVLAFLRVYWGRNSRAGAITMRAAIRDETDRDVWTDSRTVPVPTGEANTLRATDYRLELPLSSLAAGEHLLTLTATPASGPPQVRHVRFRVE